MSPSFRWPRVQGRVWTHAPVSVAMCAHTCIHRVPPWGCHGNLGPRAESGVGAWLSTLAIHFPPETTLRSKANQSVCLCPSVF